MLPSARWVVTDAVQAALQAGRAVVALESTIITHGLPRPINYEMAVAVEEQIRKKGAEPASIAVLDGRVHIGLSRNELARIAESDPSRTVKVSRGGLAHVLAKGTGWVGGTTVSGTMALAHRAGIKIFATGGIGGVHRGAESYLVELGRTRVAVFCSGAKSILDIPRTLEYLETQGVPVLTFHPEGQFPCFYTAASGCRVPTVASIEEAARTIARNEELGLENGLVFGVPIPNEFESDGAMIQQAVEQAVQESKELGIDRQGKLVTPWLLKRVSELAQHSVKSNVGLVLNNTRHAAECAVALSGKTPSQVAYWSTPSPKVMIVGCAAMDITAQQHMESPQSTAPGTVCLSAGGVALNVARAAHAMLPKETDVLLCASYGEDKFGRMLVEEVKNAGMRTDALIPVKKTAVCNLLLNAAGDLVTGTADMDVVEECMTPDVVTKQIQRHMPSVVCMDANMRPESLAAVLDACASAGSTVLFEPTSVQKCRRLIEALALQSHAKSVHLLTPNQHELACMAEYVRLLFPDAPRPSLSNVHALATRWGLPPAWLHDALRTATLAHTQFIKLGCHGVLVVTHAGAEDGPDIIHMPADTLDPEQAMNSTGAGDTFVGAVLAHMSTLSSDFSRWTLSDMVELAHAGQQAAQHTLRSPDAVAPRLR